MASFPYTPPVASFTERLAGARAPRRVLRGRDAELERIGILLQATSRGGSGLLVVEGSPGIGKTALLDETVAMARRTGVRSIGARAGALRQAAPCALLIDALCGGAQPLWERAELRRLMLRRDARYWLVEELHTTLEAAALQAPRVVVLDDLQWADAGTLDALRHLVPQLAQLPILWVLACRSAETTPALRELLSALATGETRMRLEPLEDDAVAKIVRDRLGAAGTSSLLALAAGGGGNPALLGALLDGLDEDGRVVFADRWADVVGDEPPNRLVALLRQRLDRLSAEARRAVRMAAVLGSGVGVEPLAEMMDRRPSQILDALEEASRADLLVPDGRELRFQHELLREAVLGTVPETVRTALSCEASAVRARHGVRPVELSRPQTVEAETRSPVRASARADDARPGEGWDSLTEAELRVARLVAEGATNREAAATLFLSPHTVSTHLRHCFAKLGINSRVELVRVALEHEPQGFSSGLRVAVR